MNAPKDNLWALDGLPRLFILLNRKHAGSISTAGLFILLNRKHAGSKSTAE